MILLLSIIFILLALYTVVILIYSHWFNQLKVFRLGENYAPKYSFSIIIPARNEAANIERLLQSILAQQYPKELFEVIVVDDFSTDATPLIVTNIGVEHSNVRLISLSTELNGKKLNAYKKKAIELAVASSKHEWIVTTDADCWVKPKWLSFFDAYIQEMQPVFFGAPVVFSNNGSVLETFQCIDFMALQGITAAAASAGKQAMCNGANLAYKKSVFYEVEGFSGVDNIASGDDMLLMNKMKLAYPQKLGYLFSPEVIVSTLPMDTLKGFLNQRIRWASKTNKYKDTSVVVVLWMIFLLNIGLAILPILALLFWPDAFVYWLAFLAIKTWVEASFAVKIAQFFSIKLFWWNMLLQLPHVFYTSIAGSFGLMGNYRWKGRSVH